MLHTEFPIIHFNILPNRMYLPTYLPRKIVPIHLWSQSILPTDMDPASTLIDIKATLRPVQL